MKRQLLFMFFIFFAASLIAQNAIERCNTMEADLRLRKKHPELGTLEEQEKLFSQRLGNYYRQSAEKNLSGAVTLPIVFHIVHNGGAIGSGDNISATYINAQLVQLNNDFRKIFGTTGYNTNPVGADTEVQFCAAVVDPDGNTLAEPGINRINRNTKGWSAPPFSDTYIDETIKPQSIWDPTRYINVWVLNIGGGLLGYAQFPNMSTSSAVANTDGVVVLYSSVGSSTTPFPGASPYDQGRTLTHELGHFFNLYHTFQGGCSSPNDHCDDTPRVSSPTFGCPVGRTTCSGTATMIENYMDYSDDGCMNIFTLNQKDRVRAAIMNYPRRMELLTSTVCSMIDPCVGETVPPTVTPGSIAACYPTGAAAEAAAIAATTATDNCPGTLVKTATTMGTCAATITVTVADVNNNTATATYNTRIDNSPPTVTQGSIAACYPSIAAAEAAALAATSATDNCPGTLTETASTTGTCSATITVTTTDGCSNSTAVTYSTRIDNTPPTVVCRTSTVYLDPLGTYTLQNADVLNAGASSDNCGGITVTNIQPASVNCDQVGTVVPIVVTAQDNCGLTNTCTAQITVQKGTALPPPYVNNEVGASGQTPGTATYDPCDQIFTVTSSGFSTNLTDDAHFVNRTLCGNATITAHVLSVNNGWGGIMMRESLMPGSKKVALKVDFAPSGSNSLIREVRVITNGIEQQQSFPIQPGHTWLRLTRNNNIFQGWTSPDGINWDMRFTVTAMMNNCLLSGLFTEAYNMNTVATAQFGSVSAGSSTFLAQQPNGNEPVEAIDHKLKIPVSPNPTSGIVSVDVSALIDQSLLIQVFNAYGQPVWVREIEQVADNMETIDLSSQRPGIYWISVTYANGGRLTQRIVLAK